MNFNEKMGEIFEDVEDEANPELVIDEPPDKPEKTEEFEPVTDWTGIPNPAPGRGLDDLKKTKKPLDNGWSFDEIVKAMKPSLIDHANRWNTPTFSKEDCISIGIDALWRALKTDKGIAPFPTHAFKWIKSLVQRAAGGSGVVKVPYSHHGRTDFLAGSKASISADAPMGTGEGEEETFASSLAKDYMAGGVESAERQKYNELIVMFLNNPNIGMTPNERLVLSASFGIKPNGEHSDSGPQTNNAIGQQLGVSAVRISQIKANAISKIQKFLTEKGAFTPAKALEKFDLEESKDIMRKIAESMINVLYESVNLQIDFTNGIQIVPITISEDVIKFHVDVDNKTIKDITNKDNISVMDVDKKYINKAIDIAMSYSDPKLFSEMVGEIIKISSIPVLAFIDTLDKAVVDKDKKLHDELCNSVAELAKEARINGKLNDKILFVEKMMNYSKSGLMSSGCLFDLVGSVFNH